MAQTAGLRQPTKWLAGVAGLAAAAGLSPASAGGISTTPPHFLQRAFVARVASGTLKRVPQSLQVPTRTMDRSLCLQWKHRGGAQRAPDAPP